MSLYAQVDKMDFSAFDRIIPGSNPPATYGSKVWYL